MMAAALNTDIAVAEEAWRAVMPDVEEIVQRAAQAVWQLVDLPQVPGELSVVLSDDAAIRELNREHRGKDSPTNVLAFPIGETPIGGRPWLLGDVVLALGTVRREAVRDRKAPAAHVSHLIVHGLLHLLGYDHETAAQAEAMENIEVEALRRLGYPDPYSAVIDAAE